MMHPLPDPLTRPWQKFLRWSRCLSIFHRIAIGNSIIIIIGAVAGTLITRHLAIEAADLGLIALFATIGILLSLAINSWLISQALRPLRELRQMVDEIQTVKPVDSKLLLQNSDPDICQLSAALDALVSQLEKRNRQLRALSEQVINAQEEERKRIALSLHDDTGQALSMLIINLERLENRLPDDQLELQKKLAASRQLATHALQELRKIVRDLRPTILDNLGLVPAIRWYARSNLEEAGIRVEIDATEDGASLPHQITSALFRITQEAINNIIRHSQAKSVVIVFKQGENAVDLSVHDDGCGFNTDQLNGQPLHKQQWGLVGIKERAELIGGEVSITSAPGRGTHVQVHVGLSSIGGGDRGENPHTAGR
jgi:two-component system sensor histidine kinase UhpB